MTFVVGGTAYALITGLCYAAFTATVLETIGKGGENASTQYALFVAAGNAAIAYVGLADTRFEESHGVEGVVGCDATLNIIGVIVLGAVFFYLGYFKSLRHTSAIPATKD
jgi:drug/metabolite transporter (DMT)-like permease